MCRRDPFRRRTGGAALALVAAGGAMILSLVGCGQSGPLYLPKESSLSASVSVPAPAPIPSSVPAAAGRSGWALRTAPDRLVDG